MTIATLLVASVALKATGMTGQAGMTAAIAIGGVICPSQKRNRTGQSKARRIN